MNTKTNSRKWSWIQLNERLAALAAMIVLLLLPAVVQAQSYTDSYGTWYYTTTNDSIPSTIAGASRRSQWVFLLPMVQSRP